MNLNSAIKGNSSIWSKYELGVLCLSILGFTASCIAFFPGFMSSDSFSQYASSKTFSYIDWHPPVMSWVWSILNLIFPGPEGLLYLHLCALWLGLYLWFFQYKESKLSAAILLIGVLPWVINFSGVLWKDVGLAFALLLFSAIALLPVNPWRLTACFSLLFYAVNVRHNAIFAAFPLVLFFLCRWNDGMRKIWMLVGAFSILAGLLLLGNFLNYGVLHAKKMNPSNYMMLDDLSYLSLIEKKSLVPGIPMQDIRDCAMEEVGQTRLIARDFCFSKKQSYHDHSPFQISLTNEWKNAIAKHPFEYVRFKLAAFAYLLRSSDSASFYIWQDGMDPNDMGLKQSKNSLTLVVERYVKKTSGIFPFLFKPYWWLWFGIVLAVLSLIVKKNRTTTVAQVLLASAICYVLGYLPAGPTADFRYVYWSVIAISLAALLMATGGFCVDKEKSPEIYIAALAFLVGVTFFLFNIQGIFNIDMDEVVAKSIS